MSWAEKIIKYADGGLDSDKIRERMKAAHDLYTESVPVPEGFEIGSAILGGAALIAREIAGLTLAVVLVAAMSEKSGRLPTTPKE